MNSKYCTSPLTALGLALALTGCTAPDRYPVSGEACAADDPVLELDAGDCTIAPVGVGVF